MSYKPWAAAASGAAGLRRADEGVGGGLLQRVRVLHGAGAQRCVGEVREADDGHCGGGVSGACVAWAGFMSHCIILYLFTLTDLSFLVLYYANYIALHFIL